ncbi:hypothetical protein EZMO1_1736 [Endozoicomonas montiporae CL-33]|uniref:Sialidase domain-containing protein n=1 Tax=Endozoicomonas montiporae CL-33 TaxID=570277 RepID=A0A142BAV9_9GAMM|nr:hypothetical protein EZMO1_1736 [Endozoicomonas montiporae CL-33]
MKANQNLRQVENGLLFDPECVPFRSCHASTLILLPEGDKLVAFFAGSSEGAGDSSIWMVRQRSGVWCEPEQVTVGSGLPCWNPVLHFADGVVWLFYKVGANPQSWITEVIHSFDLGNSWSSARPLVPDSTSPRGPVKNKLLVLSNGNWLAPNSVESGNCWDVRVDGSRDQGESWHECSVPFRHISSGTSVRAGWSGL